MAKDEGEKPTTDEANPDAGRDAAAEELAGKQPDEIAAELERTRTALKKANKEAADRRRRLDELEDAEREREAAKLSETEKAKRAADETARKAREAEDRATKAEAELIRIRVDREIERYAMKLAGGDEFLYPDTVPQLVDRSRVEWDAEAGKVVGVKEAVDKLAKDRPGLLKAKAFGGTPPRGTPPRHDNEPPRRGGRQITSAEEELEATGRVGGRM